MAFGLSQLPNSSGRLRQPTTAKKTPRPDCSTGGLTIIYDYKLTLAKISNLEERV